MFNAKILDGTKLANDILTKLEILSKSSYYIDKRFIIITTGNNDAGKVYANSKVKACKRLDITPYTYHYDFLNTESLNDIFDKMHDLGYPPFIIQSPIVGSVSRSYIYNKLKEFMINKKLGNVEELIKKMDVDGSISPENILFLNDPEYLYGEHIPNLLTGNNIPCTPLAIMTLLEHYQYFMMNPQPRVVILGRSELVGKPLEKMLIDKDCTVTVCHSRTQMTHIMDYIYGADLIISAMGNTNILTYNNLRSIDNCINTKTLIDVGMNRDSNGKLRGDCDPRALDDFKAYTPVPGGVGPMTVAMLMCNIIKYYQVVYKYNYAGAIPYIYPSKYTPKHMEIYKP